MGAPPSPVSVLFGQAMVGVFLSFGVGRTPGTLPTDVVGELWLPVIAVCLFLSLYSVLDCMAVGVAKEKHGLNAKPLSAPPKVIPDEVQVAVRVQANQVEQMTGYIVATFAFSLLVNGQVGGVLSCVYLVLRRLYATAYRGSAGLPLKEMGLEKYTVPCYFIYNGMAMACVVHMLRFRLLG